MIPSGQTILGEFSWDGHQQTTALGADWQIVQLGGVAPVALTDATVNIGIAGTADTDPSCTGTPSTPTAPAGKVCIYPYDWGGIELSEMTAGAAAVYLPDRAFLLEIYADTTDGDDQYAFATWAYTAP